MKTIIQVYKLINKSFLFGTTFLFIFNSFGQVDSEGIHYDSCAFEYQFEHITLKIDSTVNNVWQIGKPQKQLFNNSFSDSLAIITDSINSYPDTNLSSFYLKILLDYEGSLVLSFLHKINSDTLKDGGYIDVSYDHGNTWSNIVYDSVFYSNNGATFLKENLYTRTDSLTENNFGFSGTSNDWLQTKLQWIFWLPVKDVSYDTLMLRFNFISDSLNTNKDGWIIDDFMVSRFSYCCGLPENQQEQFNIYPNPAQEILTFKTKDIIKIEDLNLYDILGNQKTFILNHTNEIEISNLESGLYYLEILTDKGLFRKSFVKE